MWGRILVGLGLPVFAAGCAPATVPSPGVAQAAAAPAADPAPTGPARRRVSGRAKSCESTRAGRYSSDAGTLVALTMSNEGGWCGKFYSQEGVPFTGGNIIDAPTHGEARVRHLRTRSVIEYRPVPGYVGSDRFTATLTPGNGTYIEEVVVRP